jgi:hypothetical protein
MTLRFNFEVAIVVGAQILNAKKKLKVVNIAIKGIFHTNP